MDVAGDQSGIQHLILLGIISSSRWYLRGFTANESCVLLHVALKSDGKLVDNNVRLLNGIPCKSHALV